LADPEPTVRRDAAKAANKTVYLVLAGAETELDNNIIQQIADPLLHLVRNSVAHGIERNEERYELGKPDHGSIAVRAYHRGNHIYIEVEDDGRGIDYNKIRQAAIDSGAYTPDAAERLTERDLMDLLFRPGFSTAPKKTELAGRGVGLDVVKSNLSALNGEIEVETQVGIGSRFKFTDYISSSVEFDLPIIKPQNDQTNYRHSPRIFFTLSAHY